MDLGVWWDRLAEAFQHDAFHAAILAVLVGISMTETLAHLLPRKMRKHNAEKLMRITVAVGVSYLGHYLHPTTIGAGWALFAGFSAPSIHHHLQSWAYNKWPTMRPRALRR